MKLNRIKVKDFGGLKKADVEFQKGYNLLTGRTGQGKSTMIEAFDTAIRKSQRPLKNIIRWGADNAIIEADFEHEGTSYHVEELVKKKGHTKLLKSGNEEIDALDEVNKFLASRFDPALVGSALVSLQGESELISATPAQRKEVLQKIYDLEFKKQIDDFSTTKKEFEEQVYELDVEISGLKNTKYQFQELAELPYTEEQVKQYKDDISNLEKTIEIFNVDIERIKKEIQTVEDRTEKYNEKKKELDKKKLELDVVEEKKQNFEDKKNDLRAKKEKAEKEIQAVKELPDDGLDLSDLEKELENIKLVRVVSFDDKKLVEAEKRVQDLQYDKRELKKQIDLISKGSCPTCGYEFDSHDSDIFQKKLKDTEEKLKDAERVLYDLKEQKQVVEEKKQANILNKQKRESLKDKIESEKEKYEKNKKYIEEKLSMLEENFKNIKGQKKDVDEQIGDFVERINVCSLEIQKIEEELSNFGLVSTAELKQELDFISSKRSKNKETKKNLENCVEEYEDDLKQNEWKQKLNEEQEELKKQDQKKIDKKVKERDEKLKTIQDYADAIIILKKDFPNYIINSMLEDIENGMNDFVERVYGGRYKLKIRDTKSGIEIVYGENDAPVKEASGGEKQIFNIATKVSYAKLAGLGMLILDEVFSMLNDDLALTCHEAISSMVDEGIFEQVFVISHKEAVKDYLVLQYHASVLEVADGTVKKVM